MAMRYGYVGRGGQGVEVADVPQEEERKAGQIGPNTPDAVTEYSTQFTRNWGGRLGGVGAKEDVSRYREMARPGTAAPVIDQTRSDETRGIQDRALGYLGAASTGQDSMARRLGEQQTTAALNSSRSLASTVRGGPMARAAAMRSANQGQGALAARGRLATNAAAATEQAGARGAYAGALAGQRGQDLGLATSQAGLEVGQRGANDQREGFYEGLAWDTNNAQMNAELGTSAADQAAAASARQAGITSDKATREGVMTAVGAGTGTVLGGLQGMGAIPKPDPRYGGSGTSTSDIKSKTAVSDVDALKMKKRAQGAIDETKASLDRGGYFSGPPSEGMGKEALDQAIGKRVEDDLRPRYGYFDENQKPAPPDWLASYMEPTKRDTMPSDDKTKLAEAWDQGHAAAIADVEKAGRASPAEIKRRSEGDDYNPAFATARSLKKGAWDEGQKEGSVAARMKANREKLEAQAPGLAAEQDARMEATVQKNAAAAQAPPPPPPPVAQPAGVEPGYVDQMLGRAKAFLSPRMYSDERTKESSGYEPGKLADAMRSMKPSVYEYKPEYAGRAGQDVGEKNVGPMANNMERDRVASTAIERQPDGMLAIDKDKALKLTMGGLADLQMQIDQLKGRKGRAA